MDTPDAKLIFALYYIDGAMLNIFAEKKSYPILLNLVGKIMGLLSFYARGGFYTIISAWFLCRFMATSKEKLIFARY